jgi:GNAT superfamily N-acetyltransferase
MSPEQAGRVVIRAARSGDLESLRAIERAAGESFRSLGMDLVANHEPRSIDELAMYAEAGRAFVAADAADGPVGYVLLDIVDGAAHVEQVSVHPRHARRAIGRALIERAAGWARLHDLDSLTLTTVVDVPWNGPYYERLGFRYLSTDDQTPGLRAIRDREAGVGLDAWPRGCMRLRVRPAEGGHDWKREQRGAREAECS